VDIMAHMQEVLADMPEVLAPMPEAWAVTEVRMLVALLAALPLARTAQPVVWPVEAEALEPWPMSAVVMEHTQQKPRISMSVAGAITADQGETLPASLQDVAF